MKSNIMTNLANYYNKTSEEVLNSFLDSGYFPDERIKELLSLIRDDTFEPAEINGTISENVVFHKPTKKAWLKSIQDRNPDFNKNLVLQDLMTEEEINIWNKHGLSVNSEANEQRHFEKAQKIKPEDRDEDPVFWGDNYYYDLDSAIDDISGSYLLSPDDISFEEYYEATPKYIWPSYKEPWIESRCVEEIFDQEQPEDADYCMCGEADLQEAIDVFVKKNEDQVIYWPNYDKVIILDEDFWKEIYERGY